MCLTYYRREWNILGPLESKLLLFSPTRLCIWSILSHASVHYGISATSLPRVSAVWHLNSKQYCSQVFFYFFNTHTNHTTYIFNIKIFYLKHITKHIFLFMNIINTYFWQHFLNHIIHIILNNVTQTSLPNGPCSLLFKPFCTVWTWVCLRCHPRFHTYGREPILQFQWIFSLLSVTKINIKPYQKKKKRKINIKHSKPE